MIRVNGIFSGVSDYKEILLIEESGCFCRLLPITQFLKIGHVQPDSTSRLATLNMISAKRVLRGDSVFNGVTWSSEVCAAEHG